MQPSLLLSSGEFARMCNVSRELLIHYDKIGLLKPKEVRDNGYRYYSLRQLYLFDAIRFFADTGMSTTEIKEYLDNRSTESFLEKSTASIEKMERQRELLDARIGMMEKMRYLTQRALSFPKGKPRLSYWDETWYLATDIARERTQRAYADAVSEHSDFCRNVAGVSKFPLGRIVDIPDPHDPSHFYYTKLITWIDKPKRPEDYEDRLVCKPRGNYAVTLHQGGTRDIGASYGKLYEFLDDENLKPLGPVVEIDMHSYLASDRTDDYLIHISVLVEE